MVDLRQLVSTAEVYGKQAGASLAALGSFDLGDPHAAVLMLNDQLQQVADALGFEVEGVGGAAGIAAAVINKFAEGLETWTASKKAKSDAARDDQQEAIIEGLRATPIGWSMELAASKLPGQGGYYQKITGSSLAGVLQKELVPAMPLASGMGCYRQGSSKGKPAGPLWRIWPGLFPLIYNTNQLTFWGTGASIQGRYALSGLVGQNGLAYAAFDPAANLMIDGREVAAMLATFKAWAAPLFTADDLGTGDGRPGSGTAIRPLPDQPSNPERGLNTYVLPTGLLYVHGLRPENTPGHPSYSAPFVRWRQTDKGVHSMEPAAYNFVLQACARFFAIREQSLLGEWTEEKIAAAKRSSEPTVIEALKHPRPKRVTPKGRPTTTTTPGPKPGAVHKNPPRVGRATGLPATWPTTEQIEAMIEGDT